MPRWGVDSSPVQTRQFQRTTLVSRLLRPVLRSIVLPLSAKPNRPAYAEQFDDASRNAEIAIEGLLRLANRHALKSWVLVRGVQDWATSYFGAQRAARDRRRYLVYTDLDHAIPFRPEQDTLYAYMVTQIAWIANDIADMLTRKELAEVVGCFVQLNHIGREAFLRFPTTMPRYTDHQRLSLRVVQRLDQPVNCCPSLHIAYAVLLDNIARVMGERLADRSEALESIRTSTLGMFNSVLYTKQHALVDVAFGILAAREVFEAHFETSFDDLTGSFDTLGDDHPIPYDTIRAMYGEACALRERAPDLADALGRWLAERGFEQVAPDAPTESVYFDLGERRLVWTGG
jgi:hypothetical protein